MNPYSPEQWYPLASTQQGLKLCQQELENTKFLVEVKETLMRTIQRGREALQDGVFDEPLIVDNGEIVIPSPRTLLEHEEIIHTSSLQH